MKKRFWAVLALILGMTGCKANADTNQADIEPAALESSEAATAEVPTEQTSKIIETTTSTTAAEEASEDMWYNIDIDLSKDYDYGRKYEFDLDKYLERAYKEKYLLRDELDFLNDEQYDTYIKAWIFIDSMDEANGSTLPSTNSVREDWYYYHETSLYSSYISTYESFYEYLRTVFTKEAADEIMSSKHFYNADGELFYIAGEAGGYLDRIEDKYELVEKNDSEVVFEYNARHIYDNGTYGYEDGTYIDTTRTIKLVKEDSGWHAELFDHLLKLNEAEIEELRKTEEIVTIAGQEFSVDATELFLWDMPVTDEDMQKLLNFKKLKNLSVDLLADGCEINDMNVLSQIKTLETLCINGTYSDLDFLNGMTGLKSLSLMHFNCGNPEKLPNNTALTEIYLDECSVDGLDWITDFPSLKKVSFNHVDVAELDPIGELKDLEILSVTFLAGREIDFSFLQNLKKLKSLTFTPFPSSSVYDLDILADCTALEELDISGTYKDLEFCRSLTSLKKFRIVSDNHFVYDILPLAECANLQELKLGCDFDSTQLDTLKNSLPNCTFAE